MKNNCVEEPSPATLALAVIFLLAGVGLQLSYALKLTQNPIFLMIGSILSLLALLLALRYNRQRRGK